MFCERLSTVPAGLWPRCSCMQTADVAFMFHVTTCVALWLLCLLFARALLACVVHCRRCNSGEPTAVGHKASIRCNQASIGSYSIPRLHPRVGSVWRSSIPSHLVYMREEPGHEADVPIPCKTSSSPATNTTELSKSLFVTR